LIGSGLFLIEKAGLGATMTGESGDEGS